MGTSRRWLFVGLKVSAAALALWLLLFVVALFVPGENQAKATVRGSPVAAFLRAPASAPGVAASPRLPTAPPIPTTPPAQRTAIAEQQLRPAAQIVDPRRVVGDPNSFQGQNLILQGKALNVEQQRDYTWINLQAQVPGRDTTESIVVVVRPKNVQLLKDECYRVYAIGAGTQEVQRLLTGAKAQMPAVAAYAVDAAPAGARGFGCAAP